jgi:formylglycine-generating enzyme required for sulfatase activity
MKHLITTIFFRITFIGACCFLASCATEHQPKPLTQPINPDLVFPLELNNPMRLSHPSYTPELGWFYCGKLQAEPGTSWSIDRVVPFFSSDGFIRVSVGRGDSCSSMRFLATKDPMNAYKFPFTVGGGEYLVLLRGVDYNLKQQPPPSSLFYQINPVDTPTADIVKIGRADKAYRPPKGTASTDATVPKGKNYKPGETFRDCEHCPEMIALPAGSFFMGSDPLEEGHETSEGPRHRVNISRSFAMGTKEITFDEYDACVRDHGCPNVSDRDWGRGQRPVRGLTWAEVMDYVTWLSVTTGQHYFIPSEAEWEYAARAGTETPWNTGNAIIGQDGNFANQFGKTVPVGSYAPNGFGLYDTHGNVAEWVQDCIDVGYVGVPNDGSAALGPPCNNRVARGGAYDHNHLGVRSAKRNLVDETNRWGNVGIRVARSLPQ